MNLAGTQYIEQKSVDKNKRLRKIIIIAIVLLFITLIGLSVGLVMVSKNKLTLKFNGQTNTEIKNLLKFEQDGQIYVPVRDIASYFKYESYNGNYTNKSEENNQCYIENDEEAVVFTAGEDNLQKININTNEISNYHIEQPVKMIDGKLYTTLQGIEIGYNCNFTYKKETNKITINTMQYLMDSYKNKVLEKGYKEVSEEFNDEKAILNGLVIVKDDKKQFGVYSLEIGEDILECKYSDIKYIPETGDFLVESNKKFGIKTSDGKDRLKVQYDSLELISQESKLYVVKQDDYYGVINQNGETKIPLKFDKIGIDNITNYTKNKVTNKYLILDNIIPAMKGDMWVLYNVETGKLITNTVGYDKFGSSKVKNSEGVLVIPDYNIVIGFRDKKYYLINEKGEELYLLNKNQNKVELGFEEIYMDVDADGTRYTLVRNGQTLDGIETLEELRDRGLLTQTKKSNTTIEDEEETKASNTTSNNTTSNSNSKNEKENGSVKEEEIEEENDSEDEDAEEDEDE